ncbi:hypothetical protein RJT34_15903 [Clitoria ternatea]|uniref:F-box domain-containing protein n=1 Tax=Clitoria ternatea TaxID=43366 RepID=A0AAN9PD49_CLITE
MPPSQHHVTCALEHFRCAVAALCFHESIASPFKVTMRWLCIATPTTKLKRRPFKSAPTAYWLRSPFSSAPRSVLVRLRLLVSMSGKETVGKLMMEMKRQRSNRRHRKEMDCFHELPDCVLLHIMEFMDTKYAVQTCVLSKRWKDLWKQLTSLNFNTACFDRVADFNTFVSRVLSGRDGSISLLNLDFTRRGNAEPRLLNRVMKYAALHNVQELTIFINILVFRPSFDFRPFIFSCRSLTFLRLFIGSNYPSVILLPKSLQLPAIKTLELEGFTFTANGNECAEPFSTCNIMNTLILLACSLHSDAKFLNISNSSLTNLTIRATFVAGAYNIALSTPNLSSLAISGRLSHQFPSFSSSCNLTFLDEVTIDVDFYHTYFQDSPGLFIINWLQMLSNVKILILNWMTLEIILNEISHPVSASVQPPCFVRLKSLNLKVKHQSITNISDKYINRVVEYLLQNSPRSRIDILIDESDM